MQTKVHVSESWGGFQIIAHYKILFFFYSSSVLQIWLFAEMNVLKYKNNGGKQKPHKFKIDNDDFTELQLCLQLG